MSSALLAPAVTPWATTLPGVIGGAANNPGIRLIKYQRKSGAILDIWQYYLNLTEANHQGAPQWRLEYQATTAYNIPDLSTASLQRLLEKFRARESEMFEKYYSYNGVLFDPSEKCEGDCKTAQMCAIEYVDYEEHKKCMQPSSATSVKLPSTFVFLLAPILIALSHCNTI